jgi:UDP-N-acetylglucosamine--N-acetylmuramyl-(pentapeptide) pyrophosphoryl-undecaprenol N-acetylglucosamine transferase
VKLVFACGGTGGHIFPAFAVAEELEKRDPSTQIIYVCGKKDIEHSIFKIVAGRKVISVDSAPFRGKLSLLKPSFLIKLASGFFQSFKLLMREKPDAVVGFGGHFSFPVIAMAKMLKIPTMIHEQNVIPGMANRVVASWVDGVALSFGDTVKYLPKKSKVKVTGNPIRSSIEKDCRQDALEFFHFSKDKVTLLALGGSQGSESINSVFLEAVKLLPVAVKSQIQVLHLCGKMSPESSEWILKEQGVKAKAYSFFERMDLAYGVTDIAIGRSGATFLAEIAAKKIPGILIPYAYAGGHQKINAESFARDYRARVIEQKDLTPECLKGALVEMLGQNSKNGDSAIQSLNARVLLADYIQEVLTPPVATGDHLPFPPEADPSFGGKGRKLISPPYLRRGGPAEGGDGEV